MRVRRALEEKIPKLRVEASRKCTSVLILESNDIALSNVFAVAEAFKTSLDGLSYVPDLVFLVETDSSPPAVWIFKDGERLLPREDHYPDFVDEQ